MATSYSHTSWGHTVGYWWYEVSESNINTSNNTSKITVNFYVKAAHGNQRSDTYNNYPAGYGSSTPYSRIYINGTLITTKNPACFDIRYNSSKKIANGTTYHLGSASATIKHTSSGGGSITVKCQHYTSVSPSWVTLESSHGLTTITQPAPPPPPPPPPVYVQPLASLWTLPSGTFNIGDKLSVKYYPYHSGVTHTIYIKSSIKDWWYRVLDHKAGTANTWNTHTFSIPAEYTSGLGNQQSTTLYILCQCHDPNDREIELDYKQGSVQIKNNNYDLYIQDLWIQESTYIENGKYTAGKTSMHVYYKAVSTFDIKRVDFQMWGSNSNSGGWDWPGKSSTWDSGIVWGVGELGIKCTVTDTAGHTATKDIYARVYEEEHRLNITSFEQTNGNIYILKNHTIGNSRFKLVVKWDNTHTITNVSFNVTGANPMSHSKSNPGGKSYTWLTDNVYNVGDNKITVTITDSKGSVKTSTINVKTSEEAYTMNVDNSYVDSNLCVNLVKGLAYMDYSRIGVRIKVNHTHALKTVKVTIDGKEYTLSNIDQYASEFTFIDSNKVAKAGNITIKFYAKDVNGREDSHTITYATYKIIEPPKKPTISYEVNENRLLLSEGEKIVFKGESTKVEDYQIIYTLESCDVVAATAFCDSNTNSYIGVDQGVLTTNLKNSLSGAPRYVILKDFGVNSNNSIVTQDINDAQKFHIHPLEPNHNDRFYALQFLSGAKPGDKIGIYVRERKMGTFDVYLYSDNYKYDTVPKNDFFTMCILPPSPCALSIYKQEQTSDKIVIKYPNPIYDLNVNNDAVNLIDVCLIAKDATGNLLDKQGNKSKSENRKRDGLNGKTWVYYTDRQWHNIVPKKTTTYNNKKEFEMIFDISNFPKGTCFSIVAFYYPDYYRHPSIYSTSNVININKTNIQMNVKITEPENNSTSPTANPTFKVRVTKGNVAGFSYNSIYENYNLASEYEQSKWKSNPIWFRTPRNQDAQVPNFTKGVCYKSNHPYKDKYLTEPGSSVEFYHANRVIYSSANLFRIDGASINDEGSFKENALFLKANDNNQVHLGDIETYTLLEKGYIDFTWTQKSGRFLSIGENKIEAFTSPYLYNNDLIDYNEIQSYWISDTTLYSMPIMPFNPFRNSIIKPPDKEWEEVEGDILTVKIPYGLFKPNKEYKFTFSHYADKGFLYEDESVISNAADVQNICSSYMFLNVMDSGSTSLRYSSNNLLYSPCYILASSSKKINEVNNYDKWIKDEVIFTTPNEDKLIELDKDNKYIQIDIRVRGVNILKLKDFKLYSSDNSHTIDTDKGEIDVSVKENKYGITVLYQGSIDINFGYINPLSYKDMMDLRDYLQAIGTIYGVNVKPTWRTLVKDQSYLMACDFNDTKNYCINLFTEIKKKFPSTFVGDISAFNKLPVIKSGECRGLNTYSGRGKHYFPEWDDLLDIVFGFSFRSSQGIQSSECATWSTASDSWIRHNLYPYLKTSKNNSQLLPVDINSTSTVNTVVDYTSGKFDSSTVFDKEPIYQVCYWLDGASSSTTYEKQTSQLYFFDSKTWNEIINSEVDVVQVIFKIKNDPSHISMDFTIDDFIMSGHNYTDINQVVKDKNNLKIISQNTNKNLIIGDCTAVNQRKDIVFICTPAELQKYKGVRLSSTSSLMHDYVQLEKTCIIKFYRAD